MATSSSGAAEIAAHRETAVLLAEDGEDLTPLVGTSSHRGAWHHQNKKSSKDNHPQQTTTTTISWGTLLLTIAVALLCVYLGRTMQQEPQQHHHYAPPHHAVYVEETNPGVGPIGPISVKQAPFRAILTTTAQQQQQEEDLPSFPLPAPLDLPVTRTTFSERLDHLRAARQRLEERLRRAYGSFYYERIFLEQPPHDNTATKTAYNRGRTLFQSVAAANNKKNNSWERLKRKLMIKLLLEDQSPTNNKNTTTNSPLLPLPLVWAVLGDTNAAGHGNFRDESVTAYLERAAAPALRAAGINMQTRNHGARDGTAAPQVALCWPQLVGHDDVDVLVWDFGTTDQGRVEKLALLGERVGQQQLFSSSGPPVLLANRLGRRYFAQRRRVVAQLEERGLAALYMSELVWERALTGGVPDSLGLTFPQRRQLPASLRDLRCRDAFEAGHEQCWDAKFNVTVCENRPGRHSWHAGWKLNAILGHLQAFFLLEVVEESLRDLIRMNATAPSANRLLQELKDREAEDRERFQTTIAPESFQSFVRDEEDRRGLNFTLLAQGRAFCHTARLPAEIRYRGILTESTQQHTGLDGYDRGISQTEADATNATRGNMVLVYDDSLDKNGSDEEPECNYTQRLDRSDYFYTRTVDGWTRMLLPNKAEVEAYGGGDNDEPDLKGMLAICFAACPYNKCPRRNMDREAFDEQLWELTVNRVRVSKLVQFGEDDCQLLRNEEGDGYLWKPNADGRFEFRARVLQPDSALRIGSFILW